MVTSSDFKPLVGLGWVEVATEVQGTYNHAVAVRKSL